MKINKETLSLSKYLQIDKVVNCNSRKKLFNQYDKLIITKCFDNTHELSINENILNIDTINLKPQNIKKIITNFVKSVEKKKYLKDRSLNEILKISNLPSKRLNKLLSIDNLLILGENLSTVSCETNLINFDFSVIHALNNFIKKIDDPMIKNKYNAIKKDVIRKMLKFNYLPEKKENKTIYLCWIDWILAAILKQEINLSEFMLLNKKIYELLPNNSCVLWKILHSVNFLCFQRYYNDSVTLRKYKRYLSKIISEKYLQKDFSTEDAENIMIDVLSQQNINKEDYYHLFDVIKQIYDNSDDENKKLFCINICFYLAYRNKKQNIFCYRFIREAFLSLISDIIEKTDSLELKENQIQLLIVLFHIDSFYHIHKKIIFEKIVGLVSDINKKYQQLSKNKLHKYYDILDYIYANNSDLSDMNFIDIIAVNDADKSKILKRFQLYQLSKAV